jgi:hypothetical protein
VQFLLGHSTPAMLRRYTATYDAEKAAQAHALFSPADRLNGRLKAGSSGDRESCVFPEVSESAALAIRAPAIITVSGNLGECDETRQFLRQVGRVTPAGRSRGPI